MKMRPLTPPVSAAQARRSRRRASDSLPAVDIERAVSYGFTTCRSAWDEAGVISQPWIWTSLLGNSIWLLRVYRDRDVYTCQGAVSRVQIRCENKQNVPYHTLFTVKRKAAYGTLGGVCAGGVSLSVTALRLYLNFIFTV